MKFTFLNSGGEQSSKRLFTFILILLFVMYVIVNLFWGRVLKPTLEDNLFYLILFTFGGVAIEGPLKAIVPKTKEPDKSKPV